jgi:DDE superfamily endonuclease
MMSSPHVSIRRDRLSASGASDSLKAASPASKSNHEAGLQPAFPPSVIVDVKALVCELPHRLGLPLSRFSLAEIQREVIAEGLVAQISGATLWRWLSRDALRPWRHRTWIFPRDPDFAAKAGRVLDLYEGNWNGAPLGPKDYLISADEKTSVQARLRKHHSLPPRPQQPMYVEHEYTRGGAWAYLAAWDVHCARVFGRCEESNGIASFDRLVDQVMSQKPYRRAERVFWIVDNGSSHRGQRAADRLRAAWPNLVLVHTPVHASWLNQIEIYFSIVQRKVLTPNDFSSLDEVRDCLLRFQTHYEHAAKPFQWTFTRRDLAALLAKLKAEDKFLKAA